MAATKSRDSGAANDAGGAGAGDAAAGDRIKARCPICRAPTSAAYRPFCSKRCADVDLGRWLTGSYAISSSADDEEDGLPSGDQDRFADDF